MPENLLTASDRVQFKYANNQLANAIKQNLEIAAQFTEQQIQHIEKGIKPTGFTWHHNQAIGLLELVDSDLHFQVWHIGGRNIWGGGTGNR